MARNNPNIIKPTPVSNEQLQAMRSGAKPPMAGGTPGVVTPEQIANAPKTQPSFRVDDAERRAVPKAKQYKVVNGGRFIYGTELCTFKPGKIVSESSYDIPKLRSNGLLLEEIVEAPPVEEVSPASEEQKIEA